jgi:hypothetical protein
VETVIDMDNKLHGIEGIDYVVSRLNGKRYRTITTFHVRKEGLKNLDEYRRMFPGNGEGMDTINALTFQYLNGYYNG